MKKKDKFYAFILGVMCVFALAGTPIALIFESVIFGYIILGIIFGVQDIKSYIRKEV